MSVDLHASGAGSGGDPFASLGLRVPMPAFVNVSPVRPSVRPRTLSAMYMLGLGAGSAGGPLSGFTTGFVAKEGEEGDDHDSGVE